jgi:peptide/nickel transport system substrate-binding protein
LATSLPTPTDGGKTYSFHLRPGVRYSTGKLVQPEDIRTEIERIFQIKPPSYGRQFYRGIIGAAHCRVGHRCNLSHGIVTDDAAQTVTFHLNAPDADFLGKLALTFASAVPASASTRLAGARIVPATGPYMVAAYKPGRSITLVRNPMFHEWSADARPDGYPDKIVGTLSTVGDDPLPEVRAILQGHADAAPRLVEPPLTRTQLTELATRYPSQAHFTTAWKMEAFFLNTRVAPFDQLAVRRAVNEAFDRKAFVHLSGLGVAPTCQILPPNFPGYRRACPYGSGGAAAKARARRIIRSSGQAGAAVTVWVPSPRTAQGRFYVSFLNDLGFHAHLKVIQTIDAYYARILDPATRAQTGFFIWISDFPSDADFLTLLYSCAAFANGDPQTNQDPSELCDPAIDRLLARATTAQSENTAAASALWQKAERAILARAPLLPTDNQQNVALLSKRTGNFQYSPEWGVLLDQLWVK